MCKCKIVFKNMYTTANFILGLWQACAGNMSMHQSIDKGVHVCSYTLKHLAHKEPAMFMTYQIATLRHTSYKFGNQPTAFIRQAVTIAHKALHFSMTREIDKTSNEFCNQPTTAIRQAATADWDTHYKRQQSTSWLDSRLQEHREWKVQHWS